MPTIILCLVAGIAAGYAARKRKQTVTAKLTTALVWLLLFMLGVSIGGDTAILNSLDTIGARAAAIGAASTIGSCAAAWLLLKLTERRRGK